VRESVEAKARRYLGEARLRIVSASSDHVRAIARGAGALYDVTCDEGLWRCSCPALTRCAHVAAAQLIWAIPPAGEQRVRPDRVSNPLARHPGAASDLRERIDTRIGYPQVERGDSA